MIRLPSFPNGSGVVGYGFLSGDGYGFPQKGEALSWFSSQAFGFRDGAYPHGVVIFKDEEWVVV
jgi:hypothetical protein